MRTTLDIDDDVLAAAKERARREHRTAGAVLSELARSALIRSEDVKTAAEPAAVCGLSPFPSRGAVVTNARIDKLREDDVY